MAENESFFRKVVRFVANPATDWTELNSRQGEDTKELELEKSELKAMIERKRRNDFVRKREFDMLRRVRREGLSPEQLAALGTSSRLDDSEARLPDSNRATRPDGVKAKIDEIEQQMVGDGLASPSPRRTPAFYEAPTQPAAMGYARTQPDEGLRATAEPQQQRPAAAQAGAGMAPPAAPARAQPALTPLDLDTNAGVLGSQFAELSEVQHDPELDEAVIAFANADFELCEQSLASDRKSTRLNSSHTSVSRMPSSA